MGRDHLFSTTTGRLWFEEFPHEISSNFISFTNCWGMVGDGRGWTRNEFGETVAWSASRRSCEHSISRTCWDDLNPRRGAESKPLVSPRTVADTRVYVYAHFLLLLLHNFTYQFSIRIRMSACVARMDVDVLCSEGFFICRAECVMHFVHCKFGG